MAMLNHWYHYFPIFSMLLPGVLHMLLWTDSLLDKTTCDISALLHIQFLGEVTSFFSIQSYNAAQLGLLRDIAF
jgi:hypothetical protein